MAIVAVSTLVCPAGVTAGKAVAVPHLPPARQRRQSVGGPCPSGPSSHGHTKQAGSQAGTSTILTKNQAKPQDVWIPMTGCLGLEKAT